MGKMTWTALARRVLWGNLSLYRLYRRVRFGDDITTHEECSFWVGGFPRSSNTFTAQCLESASGGQRVAHHLHTPPQICTLMASGKPGIFVLREPRPAVISWAIHSGSSVESCLDYYIDFHRFMWPIHDELFIATFQQTTGTMDRVLARFSRAFDLNLSAFEMTETFVQEQFLAIDNRWKGEDGRIDVRRIPRPSTERRALARPIERELARSVSLRTKLAEAESIFGEFMRPNRFVRQEPFSARISADTTQISA